MKFKKKYLIILTISSILSENSLASEIQNQTPHTNKSVIGKMIDNNNKYGYLSLYEYESNYLLYTYTSDINKGAIESYSWAEGARKDEAKFQISLAFPIYRGILGDNSLIGASYTQRSWWQAFNPSNSSPFRETNYEPQIFLGFATHYELFNGWTLDDIEVGFNHQSNGRPKETSRSWNRLYTRVSATNENFRIDFKTWYRIPESSSTDDNPDLTRYMGYYRILLGYKWNQNDFTTQFHYNWNSGYGNVELGWSYPLNENIRLYSQLFSGYGESMIDYNYKQTRFGIGVMLNNVF